MSPKTDDFRQRMAILSLNPFPSDPDDTALLTRPNERLGRFRRALATCTCQIPSGGNVFRLKCPILIRTTTRTVRAESVQIGQNGTSGEYCGGRGPVLRPMWHGARLSTCQSPRKQEKTRPQGHIQFWHTPLLGGYATFFNQ